MRFWRKRGVIKRGEEPVVLPKKLRDLAGPIEGTVELPRSLYWGPKETFDLGKWLDARDLYENVIREAREPQQLTRHLNGEFLLMLWPTLHLAPRYRKPWEERFPILAIVRRLQEDKRRQDEEDARFHEGEDI